MSNLPQFNFPAFYAAAEALRAAGYDIVSPAELDDAEDAGAAMKSPDGSMTSVTKTWGDFLARDVKLLADDGINGIIFLPGWEKSKGAKLEGFVGCLCKLAFFTYDTVAATDHESTAQVVTPRSIGWVMREIANQWADDIAIHAPLPGAA